MNRIRDDWVRSRLGDVIAPSKDKADPKEFPDQPYIGLEHVEAHTMRLLGNGRGADVESTKSMFKKGDVLYGKLRPYLNKVVQPDFDGICSTDFLVFRESKQLDPDYLAQYLNQTRVADAATQASRGVELPRVNWQFLANLAVSFPRDKSEQRSIARLLRNTRDRQMGTRQHLVAAQRALHRFRQSVISGACTGRLTADWRASNPNAESIDRALAAVKGRSRHRGRSQQAVDLDLPEVPASYRIRSIDEISTVVEYGTSKRAESSAAKGVPILRMGNIQAGELDLSDLKFIERDPEIDGLMLKDGDLLFNRTNSPELVGKSAVFHSDQAMTFASYLIRVIFAPTVAEPDFVNLWINSAWGRSWARLAKTDGVSQSNINGSKLGLLPVPLPPLAEQREIVKRALNLLGAADEIGRQIAQAAVTTRRLDTAITRAALRGELLKSGATP